MGQDPNPPPQIISPVNLRCLKLLQFEDSFYHSWRLKIKGYDAKEL